jgi:hypothetical protein
MEKSHEIGVHAVYATLLAAFTAGKTIRLYIADGDATCTGVFMHLVA